MPLHPQNHFSDDQALRKILTNEPCSTAESHANIVCDDAASKCEETNLRKLAAQQTQSTTDQQSQLLQSLTKHARSFEGLDNEQLSTFLN